MKKKFAIILALFLIAVVCSAGCIDPQDPVEPVVPVDPIDPITPVDPVVPIDPEVPVEEYSVLFMLNYDDAGAYVTETVKAGEIVSKPSNPTRNGHTFKGWFTAVEGGAEYDFTQAVNADVTLYAQWSKKSSGSSGGHSHSYSWNVVKAANCTVDGQGQYVCSCGQVKATEAIPATGHLETEEVINEETHTTEVKCKACGIVLVTIPESNVLEIKTVEELKAFAETVNAGTDYAGKTVTLVYDLDLKNEPWSPIGTPENVFAGTFNGNGKTILNLKVTGTENVGFFGVLYGTVQNLKIDGAAITGNHYLGAVVGYVKSGTVSDCTVTDAVITATPNKVSDAYDNGDKVGGIVGYGYNGDDGSFTVSGCTVTDSTLTAFRDVGGIVGAANGDDVSGNNVERVSIVVDKATNAYDNDAVNGNPILGRNLDSSSLITQTVTDCTVSVIAVEQESIVAAAAAGSDIALANDIAISEILIMNGGSIDGNGKAMDVSGITPTYDCAIWTNGGTVKNLKIVGSNDDKYGDMRAIGSGSSGSLILSEDLLIENVYINNVLYAINGGGLSTVKVVVKDSEIYGWCSYSGISSFEFKNCTLGKGKSYAGYIPVYGNTAFEDCKFEDFYMCGRDNSNVGHTITFTNCMYGSEKVTAANFASLFEDDDDEEDFGKLKNYLITIDGVAVTWS